MHSRGGHHAQTLRHRQLAAVGVGEANCTAAGMIARQSAAKSVARCPPPPCARQQPRDPMTDAAQQDDADPTERLEALSLQARMLRKPGCASPTSA